MIWVSQGRHQGLGFPEWSQIKYVIIFLTIKTVKVPKKLYSITQLTNDFTNVVYVGTQLFQLNLSIDAHIHVFFYFILTNLLGN